MVLVLNSEMALAELVLFDFIKGRGKEIFWQNQSQFCESSLKFPSFTLFSGALFGNLVASGNSAHNCKWGLSVANARIGNGAKNNLEGIGNGAMNLSTLSGYFYV